METILCGDALEHLRTLEAESIHTCVTSPPYYNLRDYGAAGQIGMEGTLKEYIGKLVDVFREARRFIELRSLLKAGEIRNLKLQPQFTLQESYVTPEGERVRAVRYVADFSYERPVEPWQNGCIYWVSVVEDVKSQATRTAQYEIERKMMLERFGIAVEEV